MTDQRAQDPLGSFLVRSWLPYVGVWTTAGLLAIWLLQSVPSWLMLDGSRVPPARWGVLVGLYCWSVAGSTALIGLVLAGLRKLFNLASAEDVVPANLWSPMLLGTCEALLYPTAFLVGQPEFVGVWLAVKVAGQWNYWTGDYRGRTRFNMFLIGNALSIIVAFLLARIVRSVVFA